MNRSVRNVLTLVFISSACWAAAPGQHPEEELCIRIYDFSHVPQKTLFWATAQTDRIFEKVGIRVVWEHPSADSPEAHWLDFGNFSPARSHSDPRPCLILRLMPPPPVALFPGALGFAIPFGQSGIHAELFWNRIKTEAQQMSVDPQMVLAYAMAHEIGHVLLHSSGHSRAGIMQGRWDQGAWRMVSFGLLAFLPEQATKMRANCQMRELALASISRQAPAEPEGLP